MGGYFAFLAGGQNHGPYIQRPNGLEPLAELGFCAGM